MAAALTLAVAPGVTQLTLRTDGHALVPAEAPEILVDAEIRERFHVFDPIAVVVTTDDPRGVYNLRTLALVRDLTEAFRRLEGIEPWAVTSLATEKGDRVYPGSLRFRPLLDPFPADARDLERIRDDVRAIRLYTGTVVSSDERAAAILVGVPNDADRAALYRAVREVIAGYDPGADRVDVIGAPVAEALLGTHILEDLGVPAVVLGQSLEGDDPSGASPPPGRWEALRLTIARRVGLVPIAIALIGVVFWIRFRSLAAVVLPLSEVGVCLLWVFAGMGWCDVPVYLTIAVLPVILTVVGIADEIHIFHRYQETLRREPSDDHRATVRHTLDEMWVPVVKTSVTTAVGFLSFALSPIAPVRAFGVFAALGVLFCMVWSLTVIPALLAMIPPERFCPTSRSSRAVGDPGRRAGSGTSPWWVRGCRGVTRRRRVVIVAALGLFALTPLGLRGLVVQDSWIDGFARSSAFRRAMDLFNERFLGMHTLLICVDTGHAELDGTLRTDDLDHHQVLLRETEAGGLPSLVGARFFLRPDEPSGGTNTPGAAERVAGKWSSEIEKAIPTSEGLLITFPRRAGSPKLAAGQWHGERVRFRIAPQRFLQPELLRRVAEFEAFLRGQTQSEIGGVLGPASYIATASFMERGRRPGSRAVPDTSDRAARLWHNTGRIRGEERLRQIVDADYARGVVSVFLKNANYVDTRRLMGRIRDYEDANLRPQGVTLSFSGDVAVSQALIRGIVTTQIRSLLMSLGGILILTSVLARSVVSGLLSVAPCAFAVLVDFAVMGWTGVPLGVATSMFAGMTLGVGIDYAIHLLERLRFARNRGLDSAAGLDDAVSATAPAIGIDALAVALGFGVMTLSAVPANARLGGLLVLSIAVCLAATLLLLPAVLRKTAP